jgi:CHAD domain-containing protein
MRMMADEKWISGLQCDMPASQAALHVLRMRLGNVLARLPDAVERADEDVEHVHQLRVGTRRAAAALRTFKDCLDGKTHRRLRRSLRAVRRAAGAARDWDVFLDMLTSRSKRVTAKQRPGVDFLFGVAHGQRVAAQSYLREATEGQAERLADLLVKFDDNLAAPNDKQTLRDLAVPMLTALVHELEQAARGDLGPYENLHQVRILGKQLRYAMELFESCFAAAFRVKIYPRIVEMQDILGRANDSHVTTQRLEELRHHLERAQPNQWPRYAAAIEQLMGYHRRRLPLERRMFTKWWAAWQSSGHAAALVHLLEHRAQ